MFAEKADENGDEFARFLLERADGRGLEMPFDFEQFHSEWRFIGLAKTVADFRAVFCDRATALGFAIVGTDRATGPEPLFAPNLGNAVTGGQGAIRTRDPTREFLRAFSEIPVFVKHFSPLVIHQSFSFFRGGRQAAENCAAVISRISWVMPAWRALLNSSVRSPRSFVALSFAVFIATMRALCSEALASRTW